MSLLGKQSQGQALPGSNQNQATAEIFSPAVVEERRRQTFQRLTLAMTVATGLASVGLLLLWLSRLQWQLGALAALFAACAACFGLTLSRLSQPKSYYRTFIGVSIFFGLVMLSTAALLADLGLIAAVICLIFALILSSASSDETHANVTLGAGILFSSGSAILTSFSPLPQLSTRQIGPLAPIILVILTFICVVMLAKQLEQANLRTRLVTAFLTIVLLPLVVLSVVQFQFTNEVLNREVSQGLVLAARQTTAGVDKFLSESQQSVQKAAQMEIFGRYLSLPENQRKGSAEEKEMKLTLQVLDMGEANSASYLSSYALLDNKGLNVYDSLNDRIASRLPPETLQSMGVDLQALLPGQGTNEGGEDYFKVPLQKGTVFISPVQISSSTRGSFYISAPIKDEKGRTIGVLRARYDGLLLQNLLKQYNGLLTSKSYAILVDENNIRLADAFTPNYIYKAVAPLPSAKVQALQAGHRLANLPANMLATDYTEFDQILNNYEKEPVFTTTHSLVYNDDQHSEIGAIARLRTMPWRIVYLRADYSAADVRRSQMQITTLITVIIAGLVAIVAVIASQALSKPISRLTQTAQKITNGDLDTQAPVQSADEFGMLGAAFNLMTGQMRELITQLEDRVKARTQEIEKQNETLSNRARQFQTVADVARQIVSAQELEKLLTTVTQLISDRFGFYHVGIFLLDENKQYAVLRAANSPGGQRMLARRHMLPVGKVGIVGFATGQGQVRIATDVGEDSIYFNNPDLPDTRSEMALPLKISDEVIGALDIQSRESNAFHEDDIELFTTLADQVAIAIYNNQLYTATRHALEEAQTLHRQYLRGEWAQDTTHRKTPGYLYNQFGITPQESESPLWEKVFDSGETIRATLPVQPDAPEKTVMAVPIALRGETIGVIQIQNQGDTQLWSEDEINTVNSIASQVAIALENARLFENTVRRAEREQKALKITEKIRSTNDPAEMMSIAIRELQQALGASRAQIYIRHSSAEKSDPRDQDEAPSAPNGRKNGNRRPTGSLGNGAL